MPIKLRVSKKRIAVRLETEAYIRGDLGNIDYPTGMREFWHSYSLATDHVHQGWRYSIVDACRQLGVDVEAVRWRHGVTRRYRGQANA